MTWKALKGLVRLFFLGIFKLSPLLLVGAVGFLIFWGIRQNLYADPGFRIKNLEVVPASVLPGEKLEELQKRYFNRNLFEISLQEVVRVIEEDPKIRDVRVVRSFPETLRIEAVERTPAFQIQFQSKGFFYSTAEDAVVLAVEKERNRNLLWIEAYEAREMKPQAGKRISLRGLEEAIQLAKAFWNHPLGKSEVLERVRLDHLGTVSLVLVNGPELRLGRHPMKKFHALDAVVPLLKGRDRSQIIYIDLQYQDVIVKKK